MDHMDNETSSSNTSSDTLGEEFVSLLLYVIDIWQWTTVAIAIVGTFLNLWFLVAILSSSELRSRLRNKIICNILLFCLVDTLLTFPITAGLHFSQEKCLAEFDCYLWSFKDHLALIQDFVNNWSIVSLIVVFIAQIQDFNLAANPNVTARSVTLGTYLILISPWLAAVVIVTLVIYSFHTMQTSVYCSSSFITMESLTFLKYTDTVVPIAVAVLLLILAVVLKHLRAGRNRSNDGMQDGLIGANMKIDQTRFYVLAVGMCLICDFLVSLDCFGVANMFDDLHRIIFLISASTLSVLRVLLTPFVLLFSEDIRERIKTWRPWRRSLQVPELTVHFNKEENPPTSLTYG